MTPKNRDELEVLIFDKFSEGLTAANSYKQNAAAFLLKALDAAGLAIVPKEPTAEMGIASQQAHLDEDGSLLASYHAMLDASPFKEPGS